MWFEDYQCGHRSVKMLSEEQWVQTTTLLKKGSCCGHWIIDIGQD